MDAKPYCRTKVMNRPEIPVYWPFTGRSVAVVANLASCARSCGSAATVTRLMGAVSAAMEQWNTAGGQGCTDIALRLEGTTTSTYTNLFPDPSADGKPDRINTIVWREQSWVASGGKYADPTQLLALTVLRYGSVTGEIVDADIDINGVNFRWATDAPFGINDYDLQSVLTHELGHVIGFAHIALADSTMFADSPGPGNTKQRTLEAGDIQGVCETYPVGQPTPGAVYVSRGRLNEEVDVQLTCDIVYGRGRGWLPSLCFLATWFVARRRARRRRTFLCGGS